MKIAVTGGAGFVGSNLVDILVKEGHKVHIIDNLSTGKKSNINPDAEFHKHDIRDAPFHLLKTISPEVVYHLAAETRVRDASVADCIHINVLGTANVLDASRAAGVKQVIYSSTGGARYGEPERLPVKETDPLNPKSPYGRSKVQSEQYFPMYEKDLDYKILCFGNVYGPRDDPKTGRVCPVFFDKMMRDESPTINGDGTQTRDFVYVIELANLLAAAKDIKTRHKIFNVANEKQISVIDVHSIIKTITGFKGNPRYANPDAREVKDIVLDATLARKELGWNPTIDMRTGLIKTYEWLINHNPS